MTITLPAVIQHEISKLPAVQRDIVAQQLRKEPSPPIIYEEAVRQLASVRDIDTTKRVLMAAEGLALWGRLHEDNRAIIEAQKLKAHALRQMFICAKMLGEPYKVLAERRVWSSKAKRGEELASFEDKSDIDRVADEVGVSGRAEFLVGRIAEESPLAKGVREANERKRREAEARERQTKEREKKREEQEARKRDTPQQRFTDHALLPLVNMEETLNKVHDFIVAEASKANKRHILERVTKLMELLDKIDEACKPRPPGRPKREWSS
jgi:hypothetical protein